MNSAVLKSRRSTSAIKNSSHECEECLIRGVKKDSFKHRQEVHAKGIRALCARVEYDFETTASGKGGLSILQGQSWWCSCGQRQRRPWPGSEKVWMPQEAVNGDRGEWLCMTYAQLSADGAPLDIPLSGDPGKVYLPYSACFVSSCLSLLCNYWYPFSSRVSLSQLLS